MHTDLTYGTKSYRLALLFEADSSGTCIPLIKVISTKKLIELSFISLRSLCALVLEEVGIIMNIWYLPCITGFSSTSVDWRPDCHQLQLCFGVQDFLVSSILSF